MSHTKKSLLTSITALVVCFTMLVSSTFAWFTSTVSSANNIIASGNLKVELLHENAFTKKTATDTTPSVQPVVDKATEESEKTKLFVDANNQDMLWEPGAVAWENFTIRNAGDLALVYQFALSTEKENYVVNADGTVTNYGLSQVLKVGVVDGGLQDVNSREVVINAVNGNWSSIKNFVKTDTNAVLPNDDATTEANETERVVGVVVYWQPSDSDNLYNLNNGKTVSNAADGATALAIDLGIKVIATQAAHEYDSFGNTYDVAAADSVFPAQLINEEVTVPVSVADDGTLAAPVALSGRQVTATVPAGTKLVPGTTALTMTITELNNTNDNIAIEENEESRSLDVHIDGIAPDNTVAAIFDMGQVMPTGLNLGNATLYHVESNTPAAMTQCTAAAEVDAHNEFYYNPADGHLTIALATFSEVALVADKEAAWEGNFDYSWYTNAVAPVDGEAVTEYKIANADQLAAFGAIVGGMNGQTQDSFAGKTVKLLADINLGDKESENNPNIIFYPIGYYNSEGTYERTNTAITSGLRNFEGTFDGNGHTISNFYHNTWEMKGDHDWYSPEEQYYRDGMGLFGRIYKGTVKNLTVSNFSSDGEIATTGVIAAYADGATFENIAIFNCNPRVYNIGNGGIVGCVGWYAKEADLKTTFKNITVDNSNKISALWGSYDVACGGLVGQYYPTSGQTSAGTPKNAGIDFVNCHVSAIMDVYNDVCANYQYYAYRYTGMMIGSVRENETIDGHVYPKMDGITAEGCTVHFGTWNDYYYCELVANSLASYTHDHQFSRLTQVDSVDVENKTVTVDGKTTAISTSGRYNYVVVNGKHATENATCYHFVDGKVWNHTDAGKETVNGVEVLKEDNQHIYLEFNNLFTGYGWGVTSKGVGDLAGVTILDREVGNSVMKFESKVNELSNNKEYKLGDIFSFVDKGVELVPKNLTVAVTNLAENNPVSATITYDKENWENGTLILNGTGKVTITIQDYYFCTPTIITVNVTDRQPEEKFAVVMNNGEFLHRVGNSGTVALDKLFKAKESVTVGTVSVTIEAVGGTGASGTYSNNAIQFNGTGVVKVTIKDDDEYCTQTVLYLEVVDATNVTGLSGTISGNVVLLNDCGLSSLTVSGRNTVYGNGFTCTYTGNGQYLNNGLKQGIVTVSENGTLDNLRIKASIYPSAFMYYGATSLGDYVQHNSNPREVEGDKTRYHYQLSAVVAKGNATISNCYIYGGRNNIFVDTGDVTVKDTILECAPVANIQIQSTSEYTITLENVTTIQYLVDSNVSGTTSQKMLGAGVIVGPDTTENPTIVLNGDFKQYNWVNTDDKDAVSSGTTKMIIGGALDATAYNHTVDGKTASNLGIIYMNEADAKITNKTVLPYMLGDVTMSVGGVSVNGQVYSVQNAEAEQIYSDCENADRTTINGDYLPTFVFDLADQEISYDGSEDTRYLYGDADGVTALYQDGEDSLTLDLTKLATIYKYDGIPYDVTAVCKDASGNVLLNENGVVTLESQGNYVLEFSVNDNIFYDKDGKKLLDKSVTRTYTVPVNLTVKEASIKNATVNITKTALDGVYTTVNLTDYKLRINFLECISVTDYDTKGTGTTVKLSSNIDSATLTPSGVNVFTTASTITITYTDGRVLTVNLSKISGSSPGTKTATVNTSGSVYFTTEGALDNKPTKESSQNKCTITSVSYKGNSGSTVTNDTDVTVTWALGSSSSGGSCLAEGSMITLADGSKKAVENIRKGDSVMAYNHVTGEVVCKDVVIVGKTYADNFYKNVFVFDDGTELVAINEHGIYDLDLKQYVNVDHLNYQEYIGHRFAAVDVNGNIGVKHLIDVVTTCESGYKYDIVTDETLNYVVEDTLSVSHEIVIIMNSFDFDANMVYNPESMLADIENYGLYTYEDWDEYCDKSVFEQYNMAMMKVGVEKGLYTQEHLVYLLTEIALNDDVQIIN